MRIGEFKPIFSGRGTGSRAMMALDFVQLEERVLAHLAKARRAEEQSARVFTHMSDDLLSSPEIRHAHCDFWMAGSHEFFKTSHKQVASPCNPNVNQRIERVLVGYPQRRTDAAGEAFIRAYGGATIPRRDYGVKQ